jgi:hypothetical protein
MTARAASFAWCALAALSPGCFLLNPLEREAILARSEECANGVDDNDDGDIDCQDLECASDPACAESSEEKCTDGIDNDLDTDRDCRDFGCRFTIACFPTLALERSPACAPLDRSLAIHDDFLTFDDSIWQQLGTSTSAPNVGDGFVIAPAMATRDQFVIGSERRLDLEIPVLIGEEGGLEVRLASRTADVLFVSVLTSFSEAETLTVTCGRRDQTPIRRSVSFIPNQTLVLSAQLTSTSTAVISLDGRPVCAIGGFQPLEPAVRLELDGEARIARVDLDVAGGALDDNCVGRRGPILYPSFCARAPFAGTQSVRGWVAAAGVDRYELVEQWASPAATAPITNIIHAVSPDGLRWMLAQPTDFAGALAIDLSAVAGPDPLEAWDTNARAWRREPLTWRKAAATVVLDMTRSPDGTAWTTTSTFAFPRGRGSEWDSAGPDPQLSIVRFGSIYIMAYSSTDRAGARAIGLAISPDGTTWTKHNDNPILTAEEETVESPSLIVFADRLWIYYTASVTTEATASARSRRFDCAEDPAYTFGTGETTIRYTALADLEIGRGR